MKTFKSYFLAVIMLFASTIPALPNRLTYNDGWEIQPYASTYQIFIKNMVNKQTLTLEVMASDTVDNIKADIQDRLGIPANQQTLIFAGRILQDGRTLFDYNIGRDATVYLAIR